MKVLWARYDQDTGVMWVRYDYLTHSNNEVNRDSRWKTLADFNTLTLPCQPFRHSTAVSYPAHLLAAYNEGDTPDITRNAACFKRNPVHDVDDIEWIPAVALRGDTELDSVDRLDMQPLRHILDDEWVIKEAWQREVEGNDEAEQGNAGNPVEVE